MFVSQMLEDREELRRRNAISHRDDEDPVSLRCLCVKVEHGGVLKRVVVLREFCPTPRMRSRLDGGSETCQRLSGGPNRPSAGELGRPATLQTCSAPTDNVLCFSPSVVFPGARAAPNRWRTKSGGAS